MTAHFTNETTLPNFIYKYYNCIPEKNELITSANTKSLRLSAFPQYNPVGKNCTAKTIKIKEIE